jgi:hypothetical protein
MFTTLCQLRMYNKLLPCQIRASPAGMVDSNPTLTFSLKSNYGFHAEFYQGLVFLLSNCLTLYMLLYGPSFLSKQD